MIILTDEQLDDLRVYYAGLVVDETADEHETAVHHALRELAKRRAGNVVEVDVRRLVECEQVTTTLRSMTDGG